MIRDEAREYIHEHSREYATEAWGKDKSGRGWVCPICGSGSGDKGTGITTKDGVHFTCWARCFTNADVIDIIGLIEHIPEADHVAKFEAARREFRLDVDEPERPRVMMNKTTEARDKVAKAESEPITEEPKRIFDSSPSFSGNHEYLTKKGVKLHGDIRLYEGRALLLGCYDVDGNFRGAQRIYPGMKEKPYLKGSKKSGAFFTLHDGGTDSPFLIGEGYATMASVLEHLDGESYTVIAAMDSGNLDDVAVAIRGKYPARPVLIFGDDDSAKNSAGNKAACTCIEKEIADAALFPPFTDEDRANGLTDWNDYSQAYGDKQTAAALAAKIAPVIKRAKMTPEERQEEARKVYLDRSVAVHLPLFIQGIMNSRNAVCYPTGFSELDDIFNGGFRPALYILGAVSSLGKTSFCLQLADNVAENGADVLFFSLEMSQDELIAKSLSRHTYQIAREKRLSLSRAKTTAGILAGSPLKGNWDGDTEILEAALMTYQQYAGRLFIREGGDTLGVDEVRAAVGEHIKATGKKPFVIIDYLQQLSRDDERDTDKQATDKVMKGLKHVSRDFDVPLLAISSFNRENYNSPVSMSHFKESGSIEYSCDVLIGLQYAFMDYKEGEDEKSRNKRIRRDQSKQDEISANGKPQRIEARILKNRNGRRGRVMLDFVAKYNYYSKPNDEEKFYSLVDDGEEDS